MDFTHSFPEEEELRFLFEYTNHFELYGLPLQNLDVNARAPESARSVEEATHDPLGDRVTETAREDMEKENVAWRPDEVEPEVVSTSIPAPASSSHVRAGTANSSVTKEKRKAVAVEERGVEKSSTAVPIAVSRTRGRLGRRWMHTARLCNNTPLGPACPVVGRQVPVPLARSPVLPRSPQRSRPLKSKTVTIARSSSRSG
ncbi:hypothetical protein C8T65DRAFT_83979 [Cerioporus squamosus]|nr:hypothetical protein C8T65DRAFT_83979 [Cerioporus squamosus]